MSELEVRQHRRCRGCCSWRQPFPFLPARSLSSSSISYSTSASPGGAVSTSSTEQKQRQQSELGQRKRPDGVGEEAEGEAAPETLPAAVGGGHGMRGRWQATPALGGGRGEPKDNII
ncbi:hypothetical protein E2562_033682 [Oryza meyeriana var. granulata]|uniref:Uncharacterized protein n=1 Tax=Oryza meyeriana var. granulata TaxID=110450 RepID=A0A6G1DSA1_9ORYZ|nr:hypothetical protein E2562_033682 [Oryza meyeriana var. granulata]